VDPSQGHDKPHVPAPTLWPVGFAIGIACILVGLVVSWAAVAIGGAITLVFGFLWVRDLSTGVRQAEPPPPPAAVPAGPAPPAHLGPPAAPPPEPGERFARSRFLEGATLGLGALIGGVVTVPPVGLLVASAFEGSKFHNVDLGPISEFPSGQFVITTFVEDPSQGEVSRRTAYIRYNGTLNNQPSFTIISNRCAHLGCPVQPNGPVASKPIKVVTDKAGNQLLSLTPAQPAGFGCPCHGGQYDIEGNRIAGPPVRALDRYEYSIVNGHLVLGSAYSVDKVVGTGKDARIKKYPLHNPGQHVSGPEFWLWPIPEIRA
jgi:quinol---cytochrome c reductase iron-sulfur subunit, bacillus type